jgi:hypothetical protein
LRRIWWQSGTDDAMIGALKSIEPIGFLSFAPASAGTNRADVDRRIIQNCPYGRGVAACAGMPVWFRLRRLRIIQALLGHDKLETTARYTRVATGMIANVTSPLDLLSQPRKKAKKPQQKAPQKNSETTSTEPPPA